MKQIIKSSIIQYLFLVMMIALSASPALAWRIGSWGGVREIQTDLTITRNSLGTSTNDGLVLQNTTAAAASAQQNSPRTRWSGRGWETNTGSSQQTDYVVQLVPVQGAAAPQARLDFNWAVGGGALQATPTMSLLNGNVGIGTTEPSALLAVQGGNFNDESQMIRLGAFNGTDYKIYREYASGDFIIYGTQPGYNNFSFKRSDGTVLFRILNSGNVGIGTTEPIALLHANGNNDTGIVNNLALGNDGINANSRTAIYMGYQGVGLGFYGARILQTGTPTAARASDLSFQIHNNATASNADAAWETAMFIQRTTLNIGMNQTTFGTSAAKVLSFGGPATPPTTRQPDAFTVYPFDVNGAGTMGLAWMSEDNGIGILGLKNGFGTLTPSARITSVQAGAETFLGLSGAAGNHTSIAIGRTAAEARLAIVAVDGEFAGGSLSGDAVLRVDSATNKLHLLAGAGNAMWTITNTDVKYGKALVALGGGAAPTLGTIGSSGPTVAAQNAWIQIQDSTGANVWIAVWK